MDPQEDKNFGKLALKTSLSALVAIVLIGGVAYLVNNSNTNKQDQNNAQSQEYNVGNLSLSEIKRDDQLKVSRADRLDVNGRLQVNNTVVLTPGTIPDKPVTGQIYYDQSKNRPYYFNGTSFVSLSRDGVVSLGGATGVVGLGNGLSMVNNQLTVTAIPAQVGTSLQGSSNAVTYSSGSGIAINGTAISNTGVISLAGTANQIIASAGAGAINLSLPQDIAVTSSPAFSSLRVTSLKSQPSGSNETIISFANPTTTNSVVVPDAGGTICLSSNNCGFAASGSYVNLQVASPGVQQIGNINIDGAILAGSFAGNGTNLTNVNATQLGGQSSSYYTNATNIAGGTLNDARLSTNITAQGNSFNGTNQLVQTNGSGALPALSGANLTNINGTAVSSGTIADARLTANVTLQGNTFNGSSQLVQTTAGGLLPVLSGINLTNVNAANLGGNAPSYYTNATNIVSGTLSDGRLSSNVALQNGANIFTATNLFQNTADSTAAFQIQNAAGNSNLFVADTVNSYIGIGTASPQFKLHIEGANAGVNIIRPGSGAFIRFGTAAIGGVYSQIRQTATGDINFTTNDSANTRMTILNNGNIGIGTTIPADILQVASSNNPAGLGEFQGANLIYNGGAEDGASGWTSRDFGIDAGAGSGSIATATPLAGTNSFLAQNDGGMNQSVFVTPDSVYTVSLRMRVRDNLINSVDAANGRIVVGMGSTARDVVDKQCNPNTYDVAGTLNQWVFCSATFTAPAATNTASYNIYVGFRAEGNTHSVNVDNISMVRGGMAGGYSSISNGIYNTAATLISGKVGIGTANPQGALDVEGNVVNSQLDSRFVNSYGGFGASFSNLITNPSFETNTTGWSTYGTNTLVTSGAQSLHGAQSGLVTYQNDLRLAGISSGIIATSTTHIVYTYVYVPSNWDGGQITIGDEGQFSGATKSLYHANMGLRDQWQRITMLVTTSADASGGLFIRTASAPTAGRAIYIDNAQTTVGSDVKPFSPLATTAKGLLSSGNLTVTGSALIQNAANSTTAFQVQNASSSPIFNVDTTNGLVGIGTNAPTAKLDVSATSGDVMAKIATGTSGRSILLQAVTGYGWQIELANTGTGNCTNGRLCWVYAGVGPKLSLDSSGNVRASGSIIGSTTPDISETIPVTGDVEPAEAVSADPNNTERAIKTSAPYDPTVLGVISDGTSAFKINAHANDPEAEDTGKYLVLAGRVPVKVTDEGGSIRPGDYLTTSSTPGKAMKATRAGPTIGKALGSFDGESGTVLVLVNLSYHNPVDGNNLQGQGGDFADLNASGTATIQNLVVTGIATFRGNIIVEGHIITGGNSPYTEALIAAGTGATVAIDGNDTGGTLTITIGSGATAGDLGRFIFSNPFGKSPKVILSPQDDASYDAKIFPSGKSTTQFNLKSSQVLPAGTYTFDYFIVQ